MRLIGTIENDKHAALFSDYLFVRGIDNNVELESRHYEVWVHDDEKIEEARHLLQQFMANPADPEYASAPKAARKIQTQRLEEAEAAAERSFTSRDILQRQRYGMSYVTFFLFIVSVAVGVLTQVGKDAASVQPWVITKYEISNGYLMWHAGLPEIRAGEVWRLITPVFVHFGWTHLIFNMLNLLSLGTMVERSMGSRFVLFFVLITAVLSNLAEYGLHIPFLNRAVPSFGGMSGVIYGLFGFAWMKSKYDFGSGISIPPNVAMMMVVWYFICLTGIMHIANMAHTVGFAIGLVWGRLSALRPTSS